MPRFTDADSSGWEFTPAERSRTREIVERLKAIRGERAALDAEEAALQAEAMGIAIDQIGRMPDASVYEFPVRSMAAEVALATRESPRAVQGRMDRAYTLVTRFPATHAALGEGRITSRHAQVIAEAGADLDEDAVRAAFEGEILPLGAKATPYRTKALAARVAEKYQPVSATVRHEEARERRGVWVEDQPDGQAVLCISGPAYMIHAAHDRLTAQARVVKRARGGSEDPAVAADERGLGRLRADLALDLLLSGMPSGHPVEQHINATIEVTIPVTTLAGLDDEAALLGGYGPIDADTARRLAAGAVGWERLFLHPDTGALLTVDHRTPTAAQRRYLLARDGTCRVPGCATKAKHCDIDHTIPWSKDGPTSVDNTAHLCEPHHMMKHHSPWGVDQVGRGILRYRSPAGYEYYDSPYRIEYAGGGAPPF
ncbi:HNH endonuclease signature motif containing protein [Microbacterium lacusdiani]